MLSQLYLSGRGSFARQCGRYLSVASSENNLPPLRRSLPQAAKATLEKNRSFAFPLTIPLLPPILPATWVQQRKYTGGDGGHCRSIPIATYDEIKNLPPGGRYPETLLIDVREPYEIAKTGSIPRSVNIPLSHLEKELCPSNDMTEFKVNYGRLKPIDNTMLIFYCKSGKRAEQAAQLAFNIGYRRVKVYKGSWDEWEARMKQNEACH